MATANQIDDPNEDMYICAICLENMVKKKPRHLKCMHSFCEECLKMLVGRNERLKCPSCRTITVVRNFEQDLPINFTLNNFYEREQTLLRQRTKLCQNCNGNNSDSKCHDCDQRLCYVCRPKHESTHRVLQQCPEHQLDSLYICVECTETACGKCVTEHHKDHCQDQGLFNRSSCRPNSGGIKEI